MDRRTFIKGGLVLGLPALFPRDARACGGRSRLVVHEWGTFTSIAGEKGGSLEWRPLAGEDDLPSFVYRASGLPTGLRDHTENDFGGKYSMVATVRMETPVIYFYSAREIDIDVRVSFPQGTITEWYPAAREVAGGIDWGRVRIIPRADVALPREDKPSHYYPARETDAAFVRVCSVDKTEYEKLLFYRGAGTFELPLSVKLAGERVELESVEPIATAILFENRGGLVGFRKVGQVKEKILVDRPVLDGQTVFEELERTLIGQGLFPKEAKAMIETWRDSWFEEGLRVLWTVPRKITDTILPLVLNPAPDSLMRVLVGRTEVLTPAFEQEVARLAQDAPTEQELARTLGPRARFARPVLEKLRR